MVEFVVLALVLLVPLIYLILTMGRLQAGAYAVSSAAREAGRAFVTSPSAELAAGRADAAGALAFDNLGFADSGAVIVSCTTDPCLQPGAFVRTDAQVAVTLPLVPAFLRSVVPLEVPLRAQSLSQVDPYRAIP